MKRTVGFPSLSLAAAAVAVAGLSGLAALPGAASANEIGVQFAGATGTALSSGTYAGVVSQDNWNTQNNNAASAVALKDNTGSTTLATVTYNSQGYGTANSAGKITTTPGDTTLSKNGIWSQYAPYKATITLAHIPYASYDLIFYADMPSGLAQSIEVTPTGGSASYQTFQGTGSGVTAWTAAGTPDTSNPTVFAATQAQLNTLGVPTANYAEFTGLTASGVAIVFGGSNVSPINGFQIVPVPEPAALGVMALMGAGILLVCRKRKDKNNIG